ncbi:MAG: hypothetical protein K2M81_08330 [Lachnospiraceae bacterium]|nr:hypothetical protein [Lachnospiraceae bacterium]
MEKSGMRKQILIHLSELLAERGLISNSEKNAVKVILAREEMQELVSFQNGEEVGKSGNL